MHKCNYCGAEFDSKFCPDCGREWKDTTVCPNCGANVNGTKFCPDCGHPISAASPAKPAVNPAPQTDELQNELYSLYKILEPVKELELAGLAIDAKIAELNKPLPDVNKQFHNHFVHYAPFISVDLDENLISPKYKSDLKNWKAFVKGQKEKLYGKRYDEMGKINYYLESIYEMFKQNESTVLSDLGASFLYYKMHYCFEEPKYVYSFYRVNIWDKRGKCTYDQKLINMDNFINNYLPKKLGNQCDDYLIQLFTNLKGGNRGERRLLDVTIGYPSVDVGNNYTMFYNKFDGYPETRRGANNRVCNMYEIENEAKSRVQKSLREKQEIEGSIAELQKIRKNIDGSIAEYMEDVADYINNNVTIVPFNYARQWRCVTYFLHLLVNKRGRDIYEVINQYEIDMKHQELTSALGDIHSEIRNQTKVLGSKLDTINRSIIEQTDAITSAISYQTKTLSKQLENINYSVISTGASIVGSIAQLGESMGQAMSNMKFNVTVG